MEFWINLWSSNDSILSCNILLRRVTAYLFELKLLYIFWYQFLFYFKVAIMRKKKKKKNLMEKEKKTLALYQFLKWYPIQQKDF